MKRRYFAHIVWTIFNIGLLTSYLNGGRLDREYEKMRCRIAVDMDDFALGVFECRSVVRGVVNEVTK